MNNRMKKEKIKFLIKITNNTRLLRYIVRNYFVFFSFFFFLLSVPQLAVQVQEQGVQRA